MTFKILYSSRPTFKILPPSTAEYSSRLDLAQTCYLGPPCPAAFGLFAAFVHSGLPPLTPNLSLSKSYP